MRFLVATQSCLTIATESTHNSTSRPRRDYLQLLAFSIASHTLQSGYFTVVEDSYPLVGQCWQLVQKCHGYRSPWSFR